MPTSIISTFPNDELLWILRYLVGASSILHSGGQAVLEFAKVLLDKDLVEHEVEVRKETEKRIGANGGIGESAACTHLARVYQLLVMHGELTNARELHTIALTRFLQPDFDAEVDRVRAAS